MRPISLLIALTIPSSASCIAVSGDKILVRHLAQGQPAFASADPLQVVSFAPIPGTTRTFSYRETLLLARRLGAPVEELSRAGVCFVQEARPLTRDEVLAAVVEALGRQEAQVEVIDFDQASLPQGKLEFVKNTQAHTPTVLQDGTILWRGRLRVTPDRSYPFWAHTRLTLESVRS